MTQNDGSQDAVVIERSFDAPMDLIWEMWTDPDHFKAWYGPDGTTIPGAKMDVRVGGTRLGVHGNAIAGGADADVVHR